MSAPAAAGQRLRAGAGAVVLPLPVARGATFLALAAFGALHWMQLLEPGEPGRAWEVVGVGALAALALVGAGRLRGRRAQITALVIAVAVAVLALLAGSVSRELLAPDRWGELSAGISRGISDLPGVRVPYRGLDEWVRTVIPLGGSALVAVAALLAFWPRREGLGHPYAALILLFVLYAVPAVALDFRAEFLRGALLALLVLAYLRLEKLRTPDAAAAGALALAAAVAALIIAPALNRSEPWFDYETWALDTAASKTETFTWDHTYGPLHWSRDGRELLRIKARMPAYWKAENLDQFDGLRWRRADPTLEPDELPDNHAALARWTQRITVSVRNLSTDTFITAGYALGVGGIQGVEPLPTLDGAFASSRALHRGDSYQATVYTPQPTERQRRDAGTAYPASLIRYRTILLPLRTFGAGAPIGRVTFPAFGSGGSFEVGPPDTGADARDILEHSRYARTWALARRLMRGAATPEDYIERVLGFLSHGFSYTETPPRAAENLDGFLFDAKTGYCQQYSGAMALLLRMAGIPARVATGFSSGALDSKTGEFVIRDLDAHSWVEAWFPGWGWVTFDPTPAVAPPRNQPGDDVGRGPTTPLPRPSSASGDIPSGRPDATTPVRSSQPWWPWALGGGGAALLLAILAWWLLVRRRRGRRPPLSELERALRRTRRTPAPGTTLQALERLFARTPAAAAYVRALRDARYGGRPAEPTRAQRRALRAELARGGGVGGHLRAWWALPPR